MVSHKAVLAYLAASYVAVLVFLADYANTYQAFYPAMVALANSSAFRLLMVNLVVASTILVWFAMQLVFFGKLNASEEAALLTSFTIYLAECIVVPLYFNLTLMSTTTVFFTFTLVWRLLHKLAAERVTTLSTVQMTLLPITRMTAYLNFVIISDVGFLTWLIQSRPELTDEKASLHYSLLLIYMLLVTSSLRTTVRFAGLFVLRDQHTLLPFVADAATSIAESLLFVAVYAYIFVKSTLPLLLLRGFITHVLRIFEKTSGLAEFLVLARRVRHDMPDATAEDLARDARCTICYEDMAPGSGTKRLPCGHCYHTDCLEHWLEGHSTCPYCRANILRMPAGGAGGADGGDAPVPAEAENIPNNPQPPPEAQANDSTADPAPAAPHPSAARPPSSATATPPPPQAEDDPLATRQRATAATAPGTTEAELRAAYEQYLRRVAATTAATASQSGAPTPETVATAGGDATPSEGRDNMGRAVAPPAASFAPTRSSLTEAEPQPESEETPLPPSPSLSPPPDALSNLSSSGIPPPSSSKTVDQLKLKAYKRYHRRLREAEKELHAALKQAEESGAAA